MLGGREKIGDVRINWQQFAFGSGHTRRKTIGFGDYHKITRCHDYEVYIREVSIVEGGLGCAVWDAAIILSRWIWDHQEMFAGKIVHGTLP